MGWFLLPYSVHCFFFFFFHLLLILLHFPSYTASSILPLCNHDDSSALLQIKNSFVVNASASQFCSSSSSKTASWKNGTNCCQWDGVTCDTMSGHVIGLDLSCSGLQGELHSNSTLFHLTHLQQLSLAFNDFSGSSMHSGIGDLVSLTHLNLSFCGFAGDIPSTISHLSKLVSLDLSFNFIVNPSTHFIERKLRFDHSTWNKLILNATTLEELVLDIANMSSVGEGSLSLLMNLSSSLVSLHMSGTGLQGNFPSYILCFPNLQELDLSYNQLLRGELARSNWSASLRLLDLSGTNFSRKIFDSIGHLKHLNQLRLSGCNFDGLLPLSLWNLTQLTELALDGNRFNGEIPSLLSNLKHLTTLDLQYNYFSGQIPNVFGNFTKLDYLSLSGNNLRGQLPSSLFGLTQLSWLDLANNNLEGQIPNKDTKLPKLQLLALSFNLLNGMIPRWCYSLPSLLELDLDDNKLTGLVSEFSIRSLRYLFLSNNKFQGNYPTSIFEFEDLRDLSLSSTNLNGFVDFHQFSKLKNLSFLDLSHSNFLFINTDISSDNFLPNLQILYLSSCKITKFPQFLARLQNLQELDLSNNKIHGNIPKWFNDNLSLSWKNIRNVDLSFNKLQGDLPTPPYGTQFFSVSNNNLTGAISSMLCKASSLEILILSKNNLTGTIPDCLGSFPSLWVLDLQMNNFYGSIPEKVSKNNNALQTIKLNGNRLEGPLPRSLAYCTILEVLDLGDNNIEDVFPSWLESLPELQVLVLRANKFHGSIVSFNTKYPFPQLRIFDVSNNSFSGPLPTTYFKNFRGMMNVNDGQTGLKYMGSYHSYNDSVVVIMKGQFMQLVRILTTFTTIDLSNNMFEGEIPQVIGELYSLKGLNLSHNAITGTIPQSLGNLRNLEWLDLSSNQLRGEIPMALTNLNFLSVFNLSQNQLEGIIPRGQQFNTFQNDSYEGNPMLCGPPLSKSCSNDDGHPPTTFQHEEGFGFGWKPVAVGYACGVVFGILLGCCFFLTGKPLWLARLVVVPSKRVKRRNNRAVQIIEE